MWRFAGVIVALFAMVIAYNAIPHYVTGTSSFELIVTDFRTYLVGFVVMAIMIVLLLRE
jgi:hypothetical protein